MSIRKIHYISGLVITLFTVIHLMNHAFSLLGTEKHIEVMNTLRTVYRNLMVETVLLCCVLVQIVSGIQLFKSAKKNVSTFFDKLHIWSGLYLAVFFMIHVGAVLGGRLFLDLDTNFYFGVAGLNTFPFNIFFIPYYTLAILSFFGHIAAIHSKKMTNIVVGLSPKTQSFVILVTGFVVAFILMYGLTNQWNGVEIPEEYKVLISF